LNTPAEDEAQSPLQGSAKKGKVPLLMPAKRAKMSQKWSKKAKIIMSNGTSEQEHTWR
jgi:hypothetical protein